MAFTLLAQSEEERARVFVVRVEPHGPYFDGHFPSRPVLPAVAQLELVRELLQQTESEPTWIARLDAVRFVKPILPGDELSVRLERQEDRDATAFRIHRDGSLVSEGRLRLRHERAS